MGEGCDAVLPMQKNKGGRLAAGLSQHPFPLPAPFSNLQLDSAEASMLAFLDQVKQLVHERVER